MKDLWYEMYEEAKKFYIENNHLNIPNYYCSNGYKVGYWISNQRASYKNRTKKSSNGRAIMSDERVKLLESIGMIWNVRESEWLFNYEKAKKFFEENGHLNVPGEYITQDGFHLGEWLKHQKYLYKYRFDKKKTKRNGCISTKHIKLLEDIKIVWDYRENEWMKKYEIAKKYYEKFKTLDVPQDLVYEGFRLGCWINRQCLAYRNKINPKEKNYSTMVPLTNEQVKLLENIGMIFEKRKDNWNSNFFKAKEFYLENGHLKIPNDYITPDGFKLGSWIRNQRIAFFNTNKLTEEQIKKLESIGMIWDIRTYNMATKPFLYRNKTIFERMFLEFLSNYVKENKSTFDSYEDVLKITNEFAKTIGCKENHYKPFTKIKK